MSYMRESYFGNVYSAITDERTQLITLQRDFVGGPQFASLVDFVCITRR